MQSKYNEKFTVIQQWVEITNYHWHRLEGELFNDKEFWADTLHAMTNDDWWLWVDLAPSLKIQYEEQWRRYPLLSTSTEDIKKTLMLGKPVTKKNGVGKNFSAFRLLMNIKDFVNDVMGTPTKQYPKKIDSEKQQKPKAWTAVEKNKFNDLFEIYG